MLIGFSCSEIRFLNKNIIKCLKLNAIFRQSIYFFQFFFLFCSVADNTKLHFCGLSMLSSIKCTSENTKKVQTDISRRVAVFLLTNQLQKETFIERKLRSVSFVNVLMYIHM